MIHFGAWRCCLLICAIQPLHYLSKAFLLLPSLVRPIRTTVRKSVVVIWPHQKASSSSAQRGNASRGSIPGGQTSAAPLSGLSLKELIEELDTRNVRFAPTASRQDLERLFLDVCFRNNQSDDEVVVDAITENKVNEATASLEVQLSSNASVGVGSSPRDTSTLLSGDSSTVMESLSSSGIDATGTSTSPQSTAITVEVEGADNNLHNLLQLARRDHPQEKDIEDIGEAMKTSSRTATNSLPLAELLARLNELNLRFPPTAKRSELEQLLLLAQTQTPQQQEGVVENNSLDEDAENNDDDQEEKRRQEEEAWHRRRRRQQRAAQRHPKAPWERVLVEAIPQAASETYNRAARQVRRLSRKAKDYVYVDDDGVRDVPYKYLYRDEKLYNNYNKDNIASTRSGSSNRDWIMYEPQQQQQQQRPYRRTEDYQQSGVGQKSTRADNSMPRRQREAARNYNDSQPPSRPRRRRPTTSTIGTVDDSSSSNAHTTTRPTIRPPPFRQSSRRESGDVGAAKTQNPYLLPPAGQQDPYSDEAASQKQSTSRSASERPKNRQIYSPYGAARKRLQNINGYDDEDERSSGDNSAPDELERFGSFMADVAERFMWGPLNDDGDDDGEATRRTASYQANSKPKQKRTSPTSKHWKDRLEEQFDSFLGIHEDGAYNKRWADKAKNDKRKEGGRDPFSVARGIQPKRRGLSSPGSRKKHEQAIWEEEGNLVSLLFGRTQSGNSLLFEKLLDPERGSLLNLFSSVFRSFMLVSSYVFRWASVRGAFPQPVVVIGVFSAAICAPRRRRMIAVAVALIIFRTFGELLHGYAYGNYGWDDDAEEESDAEDTDDS